MIDTTTIQHAPCPAWCATHADEPLDGDPTARLHYSTVTMGLSSSWLLSRWVDSGVVVERVQIDAPRDEMTLEQAEDLYETLGEAIRVMRANR